MTMLRLVLAALAAVIVAAGCGGNDDEKEVRDTLLQFLSASETRDVEAICRGVTDESRRMLDTIAKARVGADAECGDAPPAEGAGAVGQQAQEAVESADVAIEGDTARVEPEGEEGRLTLRKADDEWRLDLVSYPGGVGYRLQASAVCTENNLSAQRAPLPPATRAGVASEAERDADGFRRLRTLLEKLGAPPDREEEHQEVIRVLRANEADWRRAATRLKGLGRPLSTYNRALKSAAERTQGMRDEQRALQISCLGFVVDREGTGDYRREAAAICERAMKRMEDLPAADSPAEAASVARTGADVGRDASVALKRLEAPSGLETLHERSTDALRTAYAGLVDLSRAKDLERAQEKFELGALRSAIGFLRIGLDECAQL